MIPMDVFGSSAMLASVKGDKKTEEGDTNGSDGTAVTTLSSSLVAESAVEVHVMNKDMFSRALNEAKAIRRNRIVRLSFSPKS